MHMFICYGGLMPGYVDSLSHLGCYLAAIIHDYEHKVGSFLISPTRVPIPCIFPF